MNINHLVISGNCVRDPEVRTVGADKMVCSFTIANSTKFKGGDGELKEETAFIDCDAWGRQGEIAAQYYAKGSPAIVEGSLRQDNWTDKDGQKRSKLKLRVDRVHLVPRGERRESDAADRPAPAPARPVARPGDDDNSPPF